MNPDFKRRSQYSSPPPSLDGLLSRPAQHANRPQPQFRSAGAEAPRQAPAAVRLDSFSSPDGFRASSGPSMDGFRSNTPTSTIDPSANAAHSSLPQPHDPTDVPHKPVKKHKRRRVSVFKIFRRVGLAATVLIIAGGSYFGVKLYLTGRNVLQGGVSAPALASTVDASQLSGEGDGRVNVLLIGKGGDNHPGGQLTDTLLIASIDPVNKKAAVVSIPRDFWMKVAGTSSYQKVNSVYNLGKEKSTAKTKNQEETDGVKLLSDTMSQTLGIPIQYYAMFDFTGYKELVDTVGGIDIKIDEPIFDPNFDGQYGRNALRLPAGNVHLSGTQALLLGRARGVAGGYGVSSDFDRNENQRKMIVALKDKLLSSGTYTNPVKINQLVTTLGDNAKTSFSAGEIIRLNQIFKQIKPADIASIDFVTPPNDLLTTGNIAGQSVVYPKAGITNLGPIQNYLRNTLKDGFLQQESAKVAVYNDTNISGLAGKQAEILRSFGYTVTTVTDAPGKQNSPTTTVVDLTGGTKKFTKRYLEQRFKVTAIAKPANVQIPADPTTVDFIVIVGQDAANTP